MENGHEPATKADLQQLGEQLRSEFHHEFDDLKEAMRDGQTELLKAFYNFARTNDERSTATENEAASLKKRLAILESRVTGVEIRLNMPPAA